MVLISHFLVSCGNLSDPENGRVHYDSTSLESVAVYTCNDFCEANLTIRACCNGSWSGEEPKCAGMCFELVMYFSRHCAL